MRKYFKALLPILGIFIMIGCGAANSGPHNSDITQPTVSFTAPGNVALGVVINSAISVTFSEAMDPLTINTTTFTLMQGTTAVSGTVTYAGLSAVFTPAAPLTASAQYTATITTGAKDVAGNALAADYVWSFTVGTTASTTAPTVILVNPADLATGIAINSKVSATFSALMDPTTITATTFTLVTTTGGTAVAGTVTSSGLSAVFTPTAPLTASAQYTATIKGGSSGAKDLAGNALAADYVWSFTVGAAANTTAPTVILVNPADLATDIAINSKVSAKFSALMDPTTITATMFTLATTTGGTAVAGTVTYSGLSAVFTPTAPLTASTQYTATITTVAKDLAGNALAADYVWSFTVGTVASTTVPTVTLVNPADLATGIAINTNVSATFSTQMDSSTINAATFTLSTGGVSIPGTVSYSSVTAVFTPSSNLAGSSIYTATITTGSRDMAGNALAANYVWSFTTGLTTAKGPAAVNLGTAGTFTILAKTGVSVTGASAVTGNIGLSPAAATYITGFGLIMDSTNTFSTSSLVTGNIYAADYTPPTPSNMTTAVSDMETAYTDAAGRVLPDFTELGAGNIDGLTLVPGLYKWGTGVLIPTGVTISGAANDIWIFQIAQNLTVGNGAIITLSGGAQAKNIFWQVAGQTQLGTTADFKGIVLCQTAIVLKTGATMTGRALAQTAVTLDANSVINP